MITLQNNQFILNKDLTKKNSVKLDKLQSLDHKPKNDLIYSSKSSNAIKNYMLNSINFTSSKIEKTNEITLNPKLKLELMKKLGELYQPTMDLTKTFLNDDIQLLKEQEFLDENEKELLNKLEQTHMELESLTKNNSKVSFKGQLENIIEKRIKRGCYNKIIDDFRSQKKEYESESPLMRSIDNFNIVGSATENDPYLVNTMDKNYYEMAKAFGTLKGVKKAVTHGTFGLYPILKALTKSKQVIDGDILIERIGPDSKNLYKAEVQPAGEAIVTNIPVLGYYMMQATKYTEFLKVSLAQEMIHLDKKEGGLTSGLLTSEENLKDYLKAAFKLIMKNELHQLKDGHNF